MLVAAARGCSNLISLLLSRGVDVNHQTCDGDTMLLTAAEAGQPLIVDMLLDHGADINQPSPNHPKRSPLQRAVAADEVECARLLLRRGAELEHRDSLGQTALSIAACRGSKDSCEVLLYNGANPDTTTPEFGSPLGAAASNGFYSVVKCLVKHGCNINLCNQYGRSALHQAVISQANFDIIRILVHAGVDPDMQDKDGNTSLIYAVIFSRSDTVRFLLQQNCNPDLKGCIKGTLRYKYSALDIAIEYCTQDCVEMLLQVGCDTEDLKSYIEKIHLVESQKPNSSGTEDRRNSWIEWLENTLIEVNRPSLSNMCRKVIRKSLKCSGRSFMEALKRLSLPTPLNRFVAMEDLGLK